MAGVLLNIEGGIKNIQSQHIGECVYDTLQAIFFFADGFREHFANYAQDCLNRLSPKDIFQMTSAFETDIETTFFPESVLPPKDLGYLKSFVARAVRRYILIQLQNCGWSKRRVETYFQVPEITTQCYLPYKPSHPPLKRSSSLNTQAGVTTAEALMRFLEKPTPVKDATLETKGLNDKQLKQIYAAFFGNDPFFEPHYEISLSYDIAKKDRLVAIHIGASEEGGNGHSNCILRYRNNYYVCDNNVGIALPIDAKFLDNPLTRESFAYEIASSGYKFFIQDKEVLSSPFVSTEKIKLMKFKSDNAFFLYLKPEYEYILPVVPTASECPPIPALTGVEADAATSTITKFPRTNSARCTFVPVSKNSTAPTFRRTTRRVSRCFFGVKRDDDGSGGGEVKPRATRRATLKCHA